MPPQPLSSAPSTPSSAYSTASAPYGGRSAPSLTVAVAVASVVLPSLWTVETDELVPLLAELRRARYRLTEDESTEHGTA